MAENLTHLLKTINPLIQETQQAPYKRNKGKNTEAHHNQTAKNQVIKTSRV